MQEQQGAFDASRQSREDLGGAAKLASGAYTQAGHSILLGKSSCLASLQRAVQKHCHQFVTTQLLFALFPAKVLEVAVAGRLRLEEL